MAVDDNCEDSEDSDDLEVDVLPSDLSVYLPSNCNARAEVSQMVRVSELAVRGVRLSRTAMRPKPQRAGKVEGCAVVEVL